VRDRVTIIASGKLHSADQICIALGLGADAVNIARGFMIATGCIMTEKCHTGKCPVGVATTDPEYEDALVVDEKMYRVANYIITLRAGCYSLAAACGLKSPTEFNREHVVYKESSFKVTRANKLFPYPDTQGNLAKTAQHKSDFALKPSAHNTPITK
jgi:glutamate synthase domain-containing protein 2